MFEGRKIRRIWDKNQEKWYFSVVDIIGVLSRSVDPRNYWKVLKNRLKLEGSELVTKCNQLKMKAADGKYYLTDVANTETVLRFIQSIPSSNAEPLKLWLARVGYERIEENYDPELAINRALKSYLKKGYSKEWISQRLKSIEIRKALTDEWEDKGVRERDEFAILTDEISLAWAGMTTRQHKQHKGLKQESLRDNMTNLELVLNMLAEVSTTEISKKEKPKTFIGNKKVARSGGSIAGTTRKKLEKRLKRPVVSKQNYLPQQKKLIPK